MITAIAAEKDQISATLGKTLEFVLLEDRQIRRIPCREKIPSFLQKNQVEILVCNGIGNCMLELLNSLHIKVIPGVEGKLPEVIVKIQTGTLRPGECYSCADHGMTCGACSGNF